MNLESTIGQRQGSFNKDIIPVRSTHIADELEKGLTHTPAQAKYALENSRLKPVASAIYEGLWSFYKEGKLRFELGTRKNKNGVEKKIMKFWLE